MPNKQKEFIDYVDTEPTWWESKLHDYESSPATAFLRECVHIADAIGLCRRRFARKRNGYLNRNGQDSMYRIGAAAFSSMMSHFEVYQRALFAGMMEASRFQPEFRLTECCKYLERDSNMSLDIQRLLAYRGRMAPIGHLIADSLSGWHSRARVNAHFKSLVPDYVFFSGKEENQLSILWQLRHSIVHTGGWLTHADAQKVHFLLKLADRPILLSEHFVEAVARRLHGIVDRSTKGLSSKFVPKLSLALSPSERDPITALFRVSSPRPAWLSTAA